MSDFESEREWRRYLVEKLDRLESQQHQMLTSMTILKFKVGLISSAFGLGGAILFSFLQKKLGI